VRAPSVTRITPGALHVPRGDATIRGHRQPPYRGSVPTNPVPHLKLEPDDRAMLDGAAGDARRLAMRLLVAIGEAQGAPRLIDITCAHIDGCLFHGLAGLDFAERLAASGDQVRVPTTLNVSSLDLLHPDRYRGDRETASLARRLMDAYVAMGCEPTWTCAPYQLPRRPAAGEDVAWAESNAIVFVNSVLGARSDRYGDFTDICAALTGRVPYAGLHVPANRRATVVFAVRGLSDRLLDEDVLYPVLGHLVGEAAASEVPVIDGLPPVSEDRMKALGAATASSGGVALCHVVGSTPEAPTLEAALHGRRAARVVEVTLEDLRAARDALSSAGEGGGSGLSAVSVGTPHFSLTEFERLVELLGEPYRTRIPFYVSTSRSVLAEVEARGWVQAIEQAGIRLVTDTCTYVTPILDPGARIVMTDSAKWAWYAPANLGVNVVFGSLAECVRSAEAGRVIRDPDLWT
jgi:predicted aconitase